MKGNTMLLPTMTLQQNRTTIVSSSSVSYFRMPFTIEKTRMKATMGNGAGNFSVPGIGFRGQHAGGFGFEDQTDNGGKQNGGRGTKRGRGREEDEEDKKDRAPKRQATELDILISHDSVNQKMGKPTTTPMSS